MKLFCSKCNLPKEESEFFRSSNKRGYSYYCKLCDNIRKRVANLSDKAHEAKLLRDRKRLLDNLEEERKRKMEVYFRHKDNPKWRATKAKSQSTRRQRIKNSINTLSGNDINTLLDLQKNKCAKCLNKFDSKNKYTLDHILPLNDGGQLSIDNTQLLCKSCNSSKGARNIKYRQDLVYGIHGG